MRSRPNRLELSVARYFFDVHDGHDIPDFEGRELADLRAAKSAAATYAGELLARAGSEFLNSTDWRMEVRDAEGLVLFALYFAAVESAAITPTPRPPSHKDPSDA